jgi:hypothetical protein
MAGQVTPTEHGCTLCDTSAVDEVCAVNEFPAPPPTPCPICPTHPGTDCNTDNPVLPDPWADYVDNQCTCADGTGSTGIDRGDKRCLVDGSEHCYACNSGYDLDIDGTCKYHFNTRSLLIGGFCLGAVFILVLKSKLEGKCRKTKVRPLRWQQLWSV